MRSFGSAERTRVYPELRENMGQRNNRGREGARSNQSSPPHGGRDPGEPAPSYLSSEEISQLLRKPVRDFITAGSADERVPPHSPIPKLLLDALRGGPDGADYTRSGVVTG